MGGMQALEWIVRYPDTIDNCICIASAAGLSAQALAFDIIGRKAILSDPHWNGGDFYGSGHTPVDGLAGRRAAAAKRGLLHSVPGSLFPAHPPLGAACHARPSRRRPVRRQSWRAAAMRPLGRGTAVPVRGA